MRVLFTAGVAQRHDGTWTLIEVGDGQVSGLPERASLDDFSSALQRRLRHSKGGIPMRCGGGDWSEASSFTSDQPSDIV